MEKEGGLIRGVKFMNDNRLHIKTFITHRHPQITKWVREEMKSIKHINTNMI
jgi:hypothetical protein